MGKKFVLFADDKKASKEAMKLLNELSTRTGASLETIITNDKDADARLPVLIAEGNGRYDGIDYIKWYVESYDQREESLQIERSYGLAT